MDYKRLEDQLGEIEDETERLAAELICRRYVHLNAPKTEKNLYEEVNQAGMLSGKWKDLEEHEKKLYFRQALESLIGIDLLKQREDGLYELTNQ